MKIKYINLTQNFPYILALQVEKGTYNYNKSKNKKLLILIIKFEIHNNQHIYK